MTRFFLLLALMVFSVPVWAETQDTTPILIGEVSEANLIPALVLKERQGFDLAIADINAAGGVRGRPLQLISRDGGDGSSAAVLRDVEELVQRKGIRLLLSPILDNNSLAVSAYAKQYGVFLLKPADGTSRFVGEEGHDLAFRLGPSNALYGKVFAEVAATLPAKRWAFVGPDYEFGHSLTTDFQQTLKQLRPDVTFVATQWHPTFKIDAGAVVAALNHANPDALFITSYGPDISRLLREGNKRGLFKNRTVIHAILGQPEHLEPLGAEAPRGWITQGYPYDQIKNPAHKAFVAQYRARFGTPPGWFSFVGYNAILSLAQAIEKADSTAPRAVAAAMKGLTFNSLIGPLTYRPEDNQSDFGVWIGKIGLIDEHPTVINWTYKSAGVAPEPAVGRR